MGKVSTMDGSEELAKDVDKGVEFGTWPDGCSRFMYKESFIELVDTDQFNGSVVLDLGGGNGLLKTLLPEAVVTTLDVDESKQPDVVGDALTYIPENPPDVVFIRYVLHYLTEQEAVMLFSHVSKYCSRMVVIQFVNDWFAMDAKRKSSNGSGDHAKTFYDWGKLFSLCDRKPWVIQRTTAIQTTVTKEFYESRLGVLNAVPHLESIVMIELHNTKGNK